MRDVLASGVADPDIQSDLLGDKNENMSLEEVFKFVEAEESAKKTRFFTEFTTLGVLGEGAFGVVFKVKHNIDSEVYAVKRIPIKSKKAEDTVRREVKALAKLNFPFIVRYFSAWMESSPLEWQDKKDSHEDGLSDASSKEPRTFLYIQTELCEAETLKHWLGTPGITKPRPCDELKAILYGINYALKYIHDKEIIHRDLKPENIYFYNFSNIYKSVKVGDFGLAKIMTEDIVGSSDTESLPKGHTPGVGSYWYQSPELENEQTIYTNKVDIFAFGVIIFEMFNIFPDEASQIEIIESAKKGEFPELFMTKHPNWYPMVGLMLSQEPNKRPTAKEIFPTITMHTAELCATSATKNDICHVKKLQ